MNIKVLSRGLIMKNTSESKI